MSRLRRKLAAAGLGAAAALLFAPAQAPAPALAADPPHATAFLPNMSVAPGTTSEQSVLISGNGSVHNLKLSIDMSALPAHVTVSAADDFDDCVTDGNIMTCDGLGDADLSFANAGSDIEVAATDAANPGDTGSLKITIESDETDPTTTTSVIRVAEGVNLSAGPEIDRSGPAGTEVHATPTVSNTGSSTAHGVVLVTFAEDALDYATRYSNCVYVAELFEAYCEFDSDLDPGVTYALAQPLDFQVASDSQAPIDVFSEINWMTPQDWADDMDRLNHLGIDQNGPHGTGPALTLVPANGTDSKSQTDSDSSDNHSGLLVHVTGRNTADYQALGATVQAAAGSTVTLKVGLKNHGPAAIRETRIGDNSYSMLVTFPAGVTATVVDDRCVPFANGRPLEVAQGTPGYGEYGCWDTVKVSSGDTVLIPFTVKVTKDLSDAKGSIKVGQPTATGADSGWDDKPGNNTADIVINPAGDAGSLPVTGSNTMLVAGVGVVVIALGALLYWFGRRRRVTA